MNIANNIKKYRKFRGFTQVQLAKEINKSESTIQKYESGKVTPDISIMKKICIVLGISMSDLLNINDDINFNNNLTDIQINSIIHWFKDKAFDEMDSIVLREHFNDLLGRYKTLIEGYALLQYGSEYKSDTLNDDKFKEIFLAKELDTQLEDLQNWIKAFPNWVIRRKKELVNK